MFKILDGRTELFQWDTNRQIIVSDASIDAVHYSNRTDNSALVVEVKEENGLRVADIPNILLQESWDINVYGYCDGYYTKQAARIKVNPRTKPESYVYTETEVLNYNTVMEKIDAIELMPGPQGPQGAPGAPGQDGHTPVKGTDYWTETDKAEIVADVIAAIPGGGGGGSGSGLPEVTAADNGKFLRVVEGAWAAAIVPNGEEMKF